MAKGTKRKSRNRCRYLWSLWGRTELDTTEATSQQQQCVSKVTLQLSQERMGIQNCWNHSYLSGPYHKKGICMCLVKAPRASNHTENILGSIILHSINGQPTGFCLISMTRKTHKWRKRSLSVVIQIKSHVSCWILISESIFRPRPGNPLTEGGG